MCRATASIGMCRHSPDTGGQSAPRRPGAGRHKRQGFNAHARRRQEDLRVLDLDLAGSATQGNIPHRSPQPAIDRTGTSVLRGPLGRWRRSRRHTTVTLPVASSCRTSLDHRPSYPKIPTGMTAPISFAYLRPQRTQVDTRSQGCQSSLLPSSNDEEPKNLLSDYVPQAPNTHCSRYCLLDSLAG